MVEHDLDFQVGHIKNVTQLNYLRIAIGHAYGIKKLPEEIGKLQHLETLDVKMTGIEILPESIVQLQKLVRLFIPCGCALPDGIGNLKALEELYYCAVDRQSVKFIQGLENLTKLRVLKLWLDSSSAEVNKACISSLSKLLMHLQKLSFTRGLSYDPDPDFAFALMASRSWTPPLRRLVLVRDTIPSGISSLVQLRYLNIDILGDVSKEGLNILASLPMLLSLAVEVRYDDGIDHRGRVPRHVIGRQGFRHLVNFTFDGYHGAAWEFEPEAMPKLQRLTLGLKAICHFNCYGHGGVLVGLQNLSGLRHMEFSVDCAFVTIEQVQALEDDIRGAAAALPYHPKPEFNRYGLDEDVTKQNTVGVHNLSRDAFQMTLDGGRRYCTE